MNTVGRVITTLVLIVVLFLLASAIVPPLRGLVVSAWNRIIEVRTPVLVYDGPEPAERTVRPLPTQAPLLEAADVPAITSSACRHVEWFTGPNGALHTTTDVAGLLAKLDRDFLLAEGGEWSNPGFTVPAGSVFWTDLFLHPVPTGVEGVRLQGGWGVYKTTVAYVIPDPNGGGRFVRVCEGVGDTKAPVAKPVTSKSPAKPVCISATEVGAIGADGKAYDTFFEKTGYQYGKAFENGQSAPAGWFLHANSRVYKTDAGEKLLEGGRGMPVCK